MINILRLQNTNVSGQAQITISGVTTLRNITIILARQCRKENAALKTRTTIRRVRRGWKGLRSQTMKSCVGTGCVNIKDVHQISIHSPVSHSGAGFVIADKTVRITKTRGISRTQQKQLYEVD
jgi:hypothetical protein